MSQDKVSEHNNNDPEANTDTASLPQKDTLNISTLREKGNNMKELTPDQRRSQTRKERYGDDFYQKIGKKGGDNNKSNTSEKGRAAANARWERVRAEKTKDKKGENNG